MKTALLLLALVAPCDAGPSILDMLHHKKKAKLSDDSLLAMLKGKGAAAGGGGAGDEAMKNMGSIMAASQQGLAKAEAHHKKVVKAARKNVEKDMDSSASELSNAIHTFGADLVKAGDSLRRSVASSNKALKEPAALAQLASTMSWDSAADAKRARLEAQVTVAERALKKAERSRTRKLHEAQSDASSILESSSEKLSMKLGDLSEQFKKASDKLQEAADAEAATGATDSDADKIAIEDGAGLLKKASSQLLADSAQAEKKLHDEFSKVESNMTVAMKAIEDDISNMQHKELESMQPSAADAVKKVHLKAKHVKKTMKFLY